MSLQQKHLFDRLHDLTTRGAHSEATRLLRELDLSGLPGVDACLVVLTAAHHCEDKAVLRSVIARLPPRFAEDFVVLLRIAEIHARLGEPESVARCYQKAERIRPSNAWSYVLQSRYLVRQGKMAEAVAVLTRGLTVATAADSGADIFEDMQRDYLRFACFVQRADLRYGRAISGRRFHTGRAVENALFVSMVKDEEDIVYDCLNAAYRTGFRKFVIANNGSTDRTGAEIQRFIAAHDAATVVVVGDPIVGYWQDRKMNAFWRFAVEYFAIGGSRIDWVFPVDADELIVQTDPDRDLHGLIHADAAKDKTLLYGMWCNATPNAVHDDWIAPGDVDKSFPVVTGYDDNNLATKIAFRVSPSASLRMGNHFAAGCLGAPSSAASMNDQGIFLIHHPCRSRKQYRSKIVNGMKALLAATSLDVSHGNHWRETYARYVNEGEKFIDLVLSGSYERNRILAEAFVRASQPALSTV